MLIGRADVAVQDPLDPLRPLAGEVHARRIDLAAMWFGDEVVGLTDEELEDRRVAVGEPLGWLDPELAAVTLGWDEQLRVATLKLSTALEEEAVLEGRFERSPGSSELPGLSELFEALTTQRERVDQLEEELVQLTAGARRPVQEPEPREEELEDAPGEKDPGPTGRYLHDELTEARLEVAAEAIAIAREQAIRAASAARREHGEAVATEARDHERLSPPPGVREVGTGVAARERATWHAREQARRNARVITRDDVTAPRALDQLRPLIGESRARVLEELMQPLARSVQNEDEAWVRRRRAELRAPGWKLDRGAARRARVAEVQRSAAWAEARRLRESNPELARVVVEWADDEGSPHPSPSYLDAWMSSHLDRVVRALAYQDEFEIRRHMEVMQEVEISLVDPPEQLQSLIGDWLDLAPRKWDEWDGLARELEGERLFRESAAREGLQHKGPKAKDRRELEARVERFRAENGLEPPASAERAASVEAGGLGMG